MSRPRPPRPNRSKAWRMVRLVTGWVLTISGIILGPVPVLPGFVVLLPGLALLASESRWVRNLLRRLRQQTLIRRAMREAERAGVSLNLDHDEDDDPPAPHDDSAPRSGCGPASR